ncbi:MAG: YjbH domain-containing protein [Muribaculum sp.]|nr:YjbH domain-containing protein [Muribaculum sp.]
MRRIIFYLLFLFPVVVSAQQYSGMTGLIHVPSADMDSTGDARIGAHFLNKEFLPDCGNFTVNGSKYHSYDFYLSITPFWWVEAAFAITLEKGIQPSFIDNTHKYTQKDRYFSIKFNPLREGKYYPAIAVGGQDCFSFGEGGGSLFTNFYVAATKHLDIKKQEIGLTLTYRRFSKDYNHRWNGLVGGITYRPSFARNWRAIVEWTGCNVNFGIDCLLWKHLLLQASLQDGKYPSGGICYKVNLF